MTKQRNRSVSTNRRVCDCCEGTEGITPQSTVNRPGLPALACRVGTHAAFLETMKARLSSHYLEKGGNISTNDGKSDGPRIRPLQGLKTREDSDPGIALMDAWATVADVLTFYQERIANEGYLRTALERRSVLELARLIGYALRPGVAAGAWLALDLEKGYELEIRPHELKARSVPAPGETSQTFENVETIDARAPWNALRPRLNRPQTRGTIDDPSARDEPRIYLAGTDTNLKPNDPLLVDFGNESPVLYRVKEAVADPTAERTLVRLSRWADSRAPVFDRLSFQGRLQELKKGKGHPVSLKTEMSKRVLGHVNEVLRLLDQRVADDAIIHAAEHEILPRLVEEYRVATDDTKYRKHVSWIAEAVQTLRELIDRARQSSAKSVRRRVNSDSQAIPSGADPLAAILPKLTASPSVPPRNSLAISRSAGRSFQQKADLNLELVKTFSRDLTRALPAALSNATVTEGNPIRVFAFRLKAGPFGRSAPRRILEIAKNGAIVQTGEWPIVEVVQHSEGKETTTIDHEVPAVVDLDIYTDRIILGSWIIVDSTAVPQDSAQSVHVNPITTTAPLIAKATSVQAGLSRADYGITGKVTRIELERPWFSIRIDEDEGEPAVLAALSTRGFQPDYDVNFHVIRNTTVYAVSEELPLAEEPVEKTVCGGETDWIELDGLYSGLQPGRWLIFSGERADIVDASGSPVKGIAASELVMLSETIHSVADTASHPEGLSASKDSSPLPGDRTHTFIKLAKGLEYCYRRDTLTIYGNVVKATHGETRREALGSGNGQSFQSFALKQPPLTFVASPTPAGAESTLEVFVNDVQWHERASLSGAEPNGRVFTTKTANDGKTTVIFGNGRRGLRPPTGTENIRALYRNGIGRAGNVGAEQISQLMSKPLGLKGVTNPLRASGGADREAQDTARRNAPRTVMALDRLVSVSDYADFACTFAGIGKAVSTRISDGRRQWVHVTIAGTDDIPIDGSSDLYRNLRQALHDFGDPHQPVFVQVRELLLLFISANIRILADYRWETVEPAVRARLLDVFGFDRRGLGQDVLPGQVIAAAQSVPGVAYIDVDVLGGIPEKTSVGGREPSRRLLTPHEISAAAEAFLKPEMAPQPSGRLNVNLAGFDDNGVIRPAELAYLSPAVADTLILNRIGS